MPRRAVKIISAVVKASTPKKMKAKKRALVRRMTQGTLLAVTLAAIQLEGGKSNLKRRLFDSGLLDRLRAPLTRYRD